MSKNFNIGDFLAMDLITEQEVDRCEFWVLANRIVRETGVTNHRGACIQVNNDWNLDLLEEWLEGYNNKEVVNYLRYGWPLNAKDTPINNTSPPNQEGACSNPEKVGEYLKQELKNSPIRG